MLDPIEGRALAGWSDELLALRCRETGAARFFEELLERYRSVVFAACLSVLHNRAVAEDVVQEAFTKAWSAMDRFDGRNFRAWVLTIAYRLCINEIRRSFRRHEVPDDEGCSMSKPDKGPDDQLRLEIEACLEQLSPPQRVVLKLFYIEGRSNQEIVRLTGFSERAVKSYIQNGRRMFKKRWGEAPDAK